MSTSTSKAGPHIGGGAGNLAQFAYRPRYVKALDVGALAALYAPGSFLLWRKELADQGQYLKEGEAGGRRLAAEQLAELDAAGARGLIWGIEGLNEVISTGNSHVAACDVARGHAAAILAAGKVPIEHNIAVGNIEQPDIARDGFALARSFQWLWERGCPVGYHGYWGPAGVDAAWKDLAGRYQTITEWLRAANDPQTGKPIVTALALYAITEAGYEDINDIPGSGPVWDLLRRNVITAPAAAAEYIKAYGRFNASALVQLVTAFTWWHRFTPDWRDYELAEAPNGQPWEVMLSAHAAHFERPGLVVNPPGGTMFATVTSPSGLKVRETPSPTGRVLGRLEANARVQVQSVTGGWAKLALTAGGALVVASSEDQDPSGYVSAAYLRFDP